MILLAIQTTCWGSEEVKKIKEITLEEIKSLSPRTDKVDIYLYENKWVIQNFYRENLINKKIKDCMRVSAREQTICTDNAKNPTDFKPLNVPNNTSIKWYKTKYFGWTVSFSAGIGLGYLLFH